MANYATVGDWSTAPNSNGTVNTVNIAEDCPMSDLNDGERAIMAGVRGTLSFAATSGGDTYTATLSPAPDALATDVLYCLNFTTANTTTTPTINLNSLGAETIVRLDGTAVMAGDLNGRHLLAYDGTNMRVLNPVNAISFGATTFKFTVTMDGAALNEAYATIASASTVDIGAASANYLTVSGTTTITAFDTVQAGTERTLEFESILTLTNGSDIILPGDANITTAAGDTAIFRSEGSGVWRCTMYQPAAGNSPRSLTLTNSIPTPTTGQGTLGGNTVFGLELMGYGSTGDVSLFNRSRTLAAYVEADTTDFTVQGTLATVGSVYSTGYVSGSSYLWDSMAAGLVGMTASGLSGTNATPGDSYSASTLASDYGLSGLSGTWFCISTSSYIYYIACTELTTAVSNFVRTS